MSIVDRDFQIDIASNPENIVELEAFVDQLKEELDIPDVVYGNILIGLTEAVNNCIFHGNQCDESKSVKIICRQTDNIITFTATDEGDGFNFKNIPDPTAPENIEKLTGRGIFLMRQLSDNLTYTNNGSTVELKYKL